MQDGVCPEKCTCCEQMVVTGVSEVGRADYAGVYTALPGNLTQGQRTYRGGTAGSRCKDIAVDTAHPGTHN